MIKVLIVEDELIVALELKSRLLDLGYAICGIVASGEEAVELIIEAKDDDPELFKNEAADLLYHLLILLKTKKVSFSDIEEILKSRHKG